VLLHLQTWNEVDAYLERARGIIVPIGSTEQHGPNGLIGTSITWPLPARSRSGPRPSWP
jgi:creatinine amidohydrolase